MTLKDAYITQYKICISKKLPVEMGGHYQTRFEFGGKSVYVNPDGSPVVRYEFNIKGCLKEKPVKQKDGSSVKTPFHKDKLPICGRVCNKRVRAFLYKYLLFLKCDGIENPDMMKLYVLHLLANKFVFYTRDKERKKAKWKQYTPEYKNVGKLIDSLIKSVLTKELNEETKNQFRVVSACRVNPFTKTKYGANIEKSKKARLRDGKIGKGMATDNRIASMYAPELTNQELADRTGLSLPRIKEWKSSHRDELESKEERVIRMYDPTKSIIANAKLIGVSKNTVKKYKDKVKEVESVDKDNPLREEEDLNTWIDNVLDEF